MTAGVVLSTCIAIIGLSYAGHTEPAMSTLDGRVLPGAPAPTSASVQDGRWMKDVETWLDNRVVGRRTWLAIHAIIANRALGFREVNGVAIDTKSGMQLREPSPLTFNADLGANARALGATIRAAGALPLFVYVPRKEEVFADQLPPTWENTFAAARPRALEDMKRGGDVLDLTSVVGAMPTRYANYYLTDHHWTPAGAMRGLDAVIARLSRKGIQVGPAPAYRQQSYPAFYGSYARRVTAAGSPKADVFTVPTPRVWTGKICTAKGTCIDPFIRKQASSSDTYANRYAAFLGGDYPYRELRNSSPKARGTFVLLKDSYSLPLATYLAQRAKRVVLIDERKYTGEPLSAVFARVKPDAVLVVHNSLTLYGDQTFDSSMWARR